MLDCELRGQFILAHRTFSVDSLARICDGLFSWFKEATKAGSTIDLFSLGGKYVRVISYAAVKVSARLTK